MSPKLRCLVANTERAVAPRPAAEVYQRFYDDYSTPAFLSKKDKKQAAYQTILDGRVFHCDDPHDRSIHMIMYALAWSRPRYSLPREDSQGNPYRHYEYYENGFAVVMTDGVTTQRLHVDRVYGRQQGWVDACDHPYQPEKEKLYLSLRDSDDMRAQLEIARTGVDGNMSFDDGAFCWVLNKADSQAERIRALLPPVQTIGEVALKIAA